MLRQTSQHPPTQYASTVQGSIDKRGQFFVGRPIEKRKAYVTLKGMLTPERMAEARDVYVTCKVW